MPKLAAFPCWTRFVEFDTSIEGTTLLLCAMGKINVLDATRNPLLRADLFARCGAVLDGIRAGETGQVKGTRVPAIEYEDEPVDVWQSFAVMAEKSPKQTLRGDCDCLAPLWAAYFFLRGYRAGVAISQPRMRPCCAGKGKACKAGRLCGHGMAHAFTILDEGDGVTRVFDGSVVGGMDAPRPGFYGSGEHAEAWL